MIRRHFSTRSISTVDLYDVHDIIVAEIDGRRRSPWKPHGLWYDVDGDTAFLVGMKFSGTKYVAKVTTGSRFFRISGSVVSIQKRHGIIRGTVRPESSGMRVS